MDSLLAEFVYRHSAGSESTRTLTQVVAVFSIFGLAALALWAALRTPLHLRSRLLVALSGVVGMVLALGANTILHLGYYRPRPFVAMSVPPLTAHARDPSFFSDHLAVAGGLVVMVYLFSHRLWWFAVALSALTAVGRLGAGLHYPSDLVVGFTVGAGMVALVWRYVRTRFPLRREPVTLDLDQSVAWKNRG